MLDNEFVIKTIIQNLKYTNVIFSTLNESCDDLEKTFECFKEDIQNKIQKQKKKKIDTKIHSGTSLG